jgi:hypothetical protein
VVGLGIFSVLIGFYNYDTSMKDLKNKTFNTGDLASISLREPIWNFDSAVMEDIFSAILLDSDVVAIRVLKAGEGKNLGESKRKDMEKVDFDELAKNPKYINNVTKIMHDGKDLAQVQIITVTDRRIGSIP